MPGDVQVHRTTSVRRCIGCGGRVHLTAEPLGWEDARGARVPSQWGPGHGSCPGCGTDYVETHDGVMVTVRVQADEWGGDDEITRVGVPC